MLKFTYLFVYIKLVKLRCRFWSRSRSNLRKKLDTDLNMNECGYMRWKVLDWKNLGIIQKQNFFYIFFYSSIEYFFLMWSVLWSREIWYVYVKKGLNLTLWPRAGAGAKVGASKRRTVPQYLSHWVAKIHGKVVRTLPIQYRYCIWRGLRIEVPTSKML